MNIRYIAQPDEQLGRVISGFLEQEPSPRRVVFISAFAGLQTALRFREIISELRDSGTVIKIILGIDLGGTSQEVLREVLSWRVDSVVVKHRVPGHTFHPKIYLFEWGDSAIIIIGSNNITEGGFFSNYEGSVLITYDLPSDRVMYDGAQRELHRFLEPGGPVAYELTPEFLDRLVTRGDVPSELEARQNRNDTIYTRIRRQTAVNGQPSPFGNEEFEGPPPLPAHLLEGLLGGIRQRRRMERRTRGARRQPHLARTLPETPRTVITPASFYMTLPTLQGTNIPGEARVPLEAIELAHEFWGWPNEYIRNEGPRGGEGRVYWNWRPVWRVWNVEEPERILTQQVRMYMYENSSDFRFYARPLVNAGGDLGDVVRITRIAEPDAEYECVLAKRGTPEYANWISFCSQPVRNSERRFGYA